MVNRKSRSLNIRSGKSIKLRKPINASSYPRTLANFPRKEDRKGTAGQNIPEVNFKYFSSFILEWQNVDHWVSYRGRYECKLIIYYE